MSSTPRYSAVDLAEQRRRELAAARERERSRRVAETQRRQREQRAELTRRRAERRGQTQRVDYYRRPEPRSEPVETATVAEEVPVAPSASQPVEVQATSQEPRVDVALAEALTDQQARAAVLLEVMGDREEPRRDAIAMALGAATTALAGDDPHQLTAAVDELRAVLDRAEAEHEALALERERRRMIAAALAAALPERYVVDRAVSEEPDGTVRFTARAASEELNVAITDDGRGGEVIGYCSEGASYEQRVEDGAVVVDDPELPRELEEAHEQLRREGIETGPLMWPGSDRTRAHEPRRDDVHRREHER